MKIKVHSEDLKLGMYVSELDKPWVESPFLFQGFLLNDTEELQTILSTCKYVYIDTEKTPFDISASLQTLASTQKPVKKKKPKSKKVDFTDTVILTKTKFDKSSFTEDLISARKARDKTRSYIDNMLNEARMGKVVDTQKAKKLVAELASNIATSIDASMWLTQLKNRDEYTAIHSLNVCVLSLTFGRALNLPKDKLNELGLGALLHDIGKMRVPLKVLNKPGKLTNDEFEIMKSHPGMGYELIRNDKNLSDEVLTIVRNHHERLNGQGYPDKLNAKSISYFTKIVSITDVYDAITSDRVYHDGMTPHEAMQRLYEWMPDNFDEELMQKFIRTLGIYPIGSIVELKTGHIGLVVKLNETHRMKPVVMLLMNRDKEFYPRRKLVNLASSIWEKKDGRPEIKRIADAKEFNIDVKRIIDEESLT
ncbi:MAG: HD-GYP domain-containing protein [Gammaproteobacteria bacterium]|nr:HD-GYP domain-containing protein [Gammaproteobacteria bacterium]MCW8986060.1 HD-GYP domain-containing protein [Gammaproteobacteria bacterium]MCW9032321.1 HD-GYP domain-containing protein [Gammaproteobacteria bacterium]